VSSVIEPEGSTARLVIVFLGAPIAWLLHLALSYFLVALGCGTGWAGAESGVLIATVLFAAAACWAGWLGWRGSKHALRAPDGLAVDPPGVRGFLAVGGVILAVLFCGAIIITGIAPLFLPMCS
jgi:hypothetical protein